MLKKWVGRCEAIKTTFVSWSLFCSQLLHFSYRFMFFEKHAMIQWALVISIYLISFERWRADQLCFEKVTIHLFLVGVKLLPKRHVISHVDNCDERVGWEKERIVDQYFNYENWKKNCIYNKDNILKENYFLLGSYLLYQLKKHPYSILFSNRFKHWVFNSITR